MMKRKMVLPVVMSAVLPLPAFSATEGMERADNGFMLICAALVYFMTLPGIALFYGGLVRRENVLSVMTQVIVSFALVLLLWVFYGYSMAFSDGNGVIGGLSHAFLSGITPVSNSGSISQLTHVIFQGSFAAITVALITGALAERIKFTAFLLFTVIWFSLAYVPMAHMVWGGGWLAEDGALDFAGGTVVHINAAVAGLVGAYILGPRLLPGKTATKPHSLPMVFTGTAILYIGWFGFNAGSAGKPDGIAALAFLNTVIAVTAGVLAWVIAEWCMRGKPSLLGACSGCIGGLVGITPAAGTVGVAGAIVIGLISGIAGYWGVTALKRRLKADDVCDVFGIHGVCGIAGCLLTGVFTASALGGTGYAEGVTMLHQVWIQAESILVTVLWSGVITYIAFKCAALTTGVRCTEEDEISGLDISTHGEQAYNRS
ncbi:ammonium transporter AmtB [Morganella morganii]|uniref:ammonium transporter AmtB n=1 Tax=Morganella morganii TaxID=582 RepID=UPI001647DFEE|nr:ammonium transporter AmtB [Morganella morganii]MBC4004513.1 ammonium transporter AmtB [Morganella morganii]